MGGGRQVHLWCPLDDRCGVAGNPVLHKTRQMLLPDFNLAGGFATTGDSVNEVIENKAQIFQQWVLP